MQRVRTGPSGPLTVFIACALAAGFLMVTPERARACSCATDSPWVRLDRSDAAFVGELIELPDEAPNDFEGYYVFRVEQTVKGELPAEVRVRSPLSGAACGFELGVGQRIGILLNEEDGDWTGGLCRQINPDLLLTAVEPPPEPDGAGPIAALVGSTTSEGRTIAVDTEGRTLAYGAGAGEVRAYALCPGAKTVVEFVMLRGEAGLKSLISMRDLHGFHVVREVTDLDLPRIGSDRDVKCVDPEGDEILLFDAWDDDGRANGRIVRVSGDTIEVVAELPEQSDCYGASAYSAAALDPPNDLAYFTGGADCLTLYRYNMRRDELAELITISSVVEMDSIGSIKLSADGRYLALETGGPRNQTFRLLVADLHTEPVSFVEGIYRVSHHGSSNFWLSNDRMLLTGPARQGQALVVNPQLEIVATIDGLPAGPGGIQGNNIYVIGFGGRLVSAPAEGGEARELRTFLDPDVRAFMVLPQAVPFDSAATEANNFADATTADPTSNPQAADDAQGTDDSQDDGALTTGRMVGAGIVVFLTGAAGVLLAVSRRVNHGIES